MSSNENDPDDDAPPASFIPSIFAKAIDEHVERIIKKAGSHT